MRIILPAEHQRPDVVHNLGVGVDERDRPPAQEQRGANGREDCGGGEFADEEQQEANTGVLGQVAGDQLRFSDRHIERRLREFGLDGDHEDQETQELRNE